MTTSRDHSLSQPRRAQLQPTPGGIRVALLRYVGVWGWVCLITGSTLFGQAIDTTDPASPRPEATTNPPAKQGLDRLLGPQAITLDSPLLGGGPGALDVGGVVTVQALAKLETATQGQLQLAVVIQPGYHIYSLSQRAGPAGGPRPTKIEVLPTPGVQLAGPFATQTEPHRYVDQKAWPGLAIEEHRGRVVWQAPLTVAPGVDLTTSRLRGHVELQACDADTCLPPRKVPFEAVLSRPQTAQPVTDAAPPSLNLPTAPSEFQEGGAHVKLVGQLEPRQVAPGETATLSLTIVPQQGWHTYPYEPRDPRTIGRSKPTLIVFDNASGLSTFRPVTDAPIESKSSGAQDNPYHTGEVTWKIPIEVPAETAAGTYRLSGLVGYQSCHDSGSCDRPRGTKFATQLVVGDAVEPGSTGLLFEVASYSAAAKVADSQTPPLSTDDASNQEAVPSSTTPPLDASVLALKIAAAFLAGLILNVMPCVLPVIGLKIMSFVQQAGDNRRRVLVLNIWFVLGLLTVFMVLAGLAIWLGLGWGQQFQSSTFGIALAAIVFVFALSFLGIWEIPLPGFVGSGKAADAAAQEGALAAYLKGILTTLLATPCSGPLLGATLAWAVTQSTGVILAVFLAMGLGMGSPYLLIGLFPQTMRWLPKPGAWMDTFKEIMGFVLLGTVVWIFTFIPDNLRVATLALLIGLWAGCWWVGRTPLTSPPATLWRARGGAAFFALLIGLFAFHYLPEYEDSWEPYSPDRLESLLAEGTTVFVDFTADW